MFELFTFKNVDVVNWITMRIDVHYKKSCPSEPHCFAIRVPKQLIYNYTIIKAWKYRQLINKMPCLKIKELYLCHQVIKCHVHELDKMSISLDTTLVISYQLWFSLIQLVVRVCCQYRSIIFPLFCDYCLNVNKLIAKKSYLISNI
jgi:hypothetical protein